MRSVFRWAAVGVAVFAAQADMCRAAVAADQTLADLILTRLLATPAAGHRAMEYARWPPVIKVEDSEELRAYSSAMDGCQPSILLTSKLMASVIGGDADKASFVIGHELSHILLGHTKCTADGGDTSVARQVFGRQQEFAADELGMQLAVAAGYRYAQAKRLFKALEEVAADAPIETLAADHPSTTERAARLDQEQAQIWEAMSSFADGVFLLGSGEYKAAYEAFDWVTQQFPYAYDALHNSGYAHLMLYIGALKEQDMRDLKLGPVIAGGYFHDPNYLKGKLRGRNVDEWKLAKLLLEAADKAKPDDSLIQTNLGLALLVAPDDSWAAPAPEILKRAIAVSKGPKERLAAEVNLAVVYRRLGQTAAAEGAFSAAERDIQALAREDAIAQAAEAALLFEPSWLQERPASGADAKEAAAHLQKFLKRSKPGSPWWAMAYEEYRSTCGELKIQPNPESAYEASAGGYRQVISIALPVHTVVLGEPIETAERALGSGVEVPIAPDTGLTKVEYPKLGIDLVGVDRVLAIVVRQPQAPAVMIRSRGMPRENAVSIRVGDSDQQLISLQMISGEQPNDYAFTGDGPHYTFLRGLGLGYREDAQGKVAELVIAGGSLGAAN